MNLAYIEEKERDEVRGFLAKIWEHVGAIENPGRRIRCAGGEIRIWDVSGVNLGRSPDGRWLRLATAIDVTERLAQEAALRSSKDEAEKANTAKSVFLSRMSHELRTPLNAILGFGQVLELTSLDEQDRQAVQHILKGGRHLLGMIDEVLDLSRVEAGELLLKLADVSLDKLVSECVGLVAKMAQARKITCAVTITPASHLRVQADEQRLHQVLLNLLSNAIKYNREGGQVTLSCQPPRNGRVRLNVTDTGPGIAKVDQARLFVPFERLGQEYREIEGTGLGLVVSRQLMEAMGGSLKVTSRVGRGSTFWIELPVARKVDRASKAVAATPVQLQGPTAATLLYIEDNLSNVQVIRSVIDRLRPHWRLLSETDGRSGLARARRDAPDVILLDLQLPGINGDEVLTALKEDPRTQAIPILLLSADATAQSQERLLALGATDYISKPFNVAGLLEKLDSLLLV